MRRSTKGLTIVEIIIAVSILAIILAIAIPNYGLNKANIKLKAETKLFAAFIRDMQTYSRVQGINVALYGEDPDTTVPFVRTVRARNIVTGYERIYKGSSGIAFSCFTSPLQQPMTVTPNGFLHSTGLRMLNVEFRVKSEGTPRIYQVFVNDVGSSRLCTYNASNPAGGPDE
jgi:prepilin-type N-terminal cleavage/methylation domain-containing protein